MTFPIMSFPRLSQTSRALKPQAFLLLVALCGPATVSAAPTPEVYWSGFTFKGASASVEKRYPRLYRLVAGNDTIQSVGTDAQTYFREWFRSRSRRIPGVALKNGLAEIDKTSTALSFAVTEETVLVEKLSANYKLNIQLGFEVVLLDFEKLKVVSSTPVLIELRDTTVVEPDDSYFLDRIAKMTFGEDSQLTKALESKLPHIKPRGQGRGPTLRVLSATISNQAKDYLPAYMLEGLGAELNSAQIILGQTFSYMLNDQAGIALLPFIKDQANASMALVFADGSVVDFQVPYPSFAIDLNLKGFKKVRVKETRAESLWIYGAYLDLRLHDPDLKTEYINATYKHGVQKLIPATQTHVDDFPVFNEALKGAILKAIMGMQADSKTKRVVLANCKL